MYPVTYIYSKFKDSVFVYQFYQVSRYITSLLLSIIMVKSALPSEQLGYYEMILFIIVSLSSAWSSGINNGVFSLYKKMTNDEKLNLPYNFVIVLAVLSFIFALVIILFKGTISTTFTSIDNLPRLEWGAVYLFFSVPLIAIEGIKFLNNQYKKLTIYTLVTQLSILIVFIIVAMLRPSLDMFLLVLILWSAIKWIYLMFMVEIWKIKAFDFQFSKKIFQYSTPLILTMIFAMGMDIVDGIFVGHYFSPDYFSVFRYGAREMPLSALLLSSLSVALIPQINLSQDSHDNLKRRTTQLLHILYPLSFVLMIVSPYVFPIFYSDMYKDSAYIFNIYLLILMSRILLPQTFTMALQKHNVILVSSILELLLNIILSFWFINIWGVYGLAMATVIAYFFQKVFLMFYNQKYLGIRLSSYINWNYYLFYNIILILLFIFTFIKK